MDEVVVVVKEEVVEEEGVSRTFSRSACCLMKWAKRCGRLIIVCRRPPKPISIEKPRSPLRQCAAMYLTKCYKNIVKEGCCNVRARVVIGFVVFEAAAAALPLKSVSHEPALRIRNVGLRQGQRVLKQRQNCGELVLQRLHGGAHFVHADADGLLLAAKLL